MMPGKTQLPWFVLLFIASLLSAPEPAPGAAIPHLVRDLYPGTPNGVYTGNFGMVSNGRVVIFRAYGSASGSYKLWASDGTDAGTVALTALPYSSTMLAADRNGRVYFDNNGSEVWITDGTPAGTHFLAKISSTSATVKITFTMAVDSGLYFVADVGGWGILYYTDGTTVRRVKDYLGNAAYAPPFGKIELVACQGHVLYFTITSTTGLELWKTDGSTSGTVRIYQFGMNVMGVPAYVAFIGNMMYFTETITTYHSALWKTDGTPVGTVLVSDNMNVPLFFPTTFQDRIYFLGYSSSGRYNTILYKSDGTGSGTAALTMAEGYPIYASATSTMLYFATTASFMKTSGGSPQWIGNITFASGMHRPIIQVPGEEHWILSAQGGNSLGQELWESDGTGAGTQMIADIYYGSGNSSPDDFTVCGDQLFFTAKDAVHGRELWVMPLHEALTGAREWSGYE